MSLLSELLAESAPHGNPANPANRRICGMPNNAQVSKLAELAKPILAAAPVDSPKVRERLLATPVAEYLDAGLVRALVESGAHANPANPANRNVSGTPNHAEISELAELARPSFTAAPVNSAKVRARLLAVAAAEYLDAGLVRALPESELTAIAEQLADYDAIKLREALRMYLQTLVEDATMRAGKLPPTYDTPAMCRHCGPVWLPHAQVVWLDVVDGWPTAWGCPWCFIHTPRGLRIPRPPYVERSNHSDNREGGGP